MAWRFEGTFTVRASSTRVWSFFLSPQEFSSAIDDPHTIEVIDADHFRGTIKAGVAFIRGTFTWSATVKERVPPERAQMAVHGSGMGSAFYIVATLSVSELAGLSRVKWAAVFEFIRSVVAMVLRLLQASFLFMSITVLFIARKVLG